MRYNGRMLLAIDIGNTQTVLGIFEDVHRPELLHSWRIATDKTCTGDELRVLLKSLFAVDELSLESIDGVALASVVPNLTREWIPALQRIAPERVYLCNAENAAVLFEADYPRPNEIGADRVADAVAAKALFGAPVVVVDFGTATNIEIVDREGRFVGGIIAPGVLTSAEALFSRASKLSSIPLDDPGHPIGRSTEEAVQSGILYGEAERVDGLLRRVFEQLGYEAPVVATGGLAETMTQYSNRLTHLCGELTLEGLRLLYEACM